MHKDLKQDFYAFLAAASKGLDAVLLALPVCCTALDSNPTNC